MARRDHRKGLDTTTISVKLTGPELGALDDVRKHHESLFSQYRTETRGDALRRLISEAAERRADEKKRTDERQVTLNPPLGPWDLVWASPPCDSFSTVRTDGGRNCDLTLVRECLRIIDAAQPRWWVLISEAAERRADEKKRTDERQVTLNEAIASAPPADKTEQLVPKKQLLRKTGNAGAATRRTHSANRR